MAVWYGSWAFPRTDWFKTQFGLVRLSDPIWLNQLHRSNLHDSPIASSSPDRSSSEARKLWESFINGGRSGSRHGDQRLGPDPSLRRDGSNRRSPLLRLQAHAFVSISRREDRQRRVSHQIPYLETDLVIRISWLSFGCIQASCNQGSESEGRRQFHPAQVLPSSEILLQQRGMVVRLMETCSSSKRF